MGVKAKERPAGSGVWWVFINHNGKRKAKKIGKDKKLAHDVAQKFNARLVLGDELIVGKKEKVEKKKDKEPINNILTDMFCHDPNKRYLSKYLRMAILKRDKEKCVKCGNKGKYCRLEVDHIIPFSIGGRTTAHNLQTLCSICNVGKSNVFAG